MDWFEPLTGFREENYTDTRAKLTVEGSNLRSLVNGRSYGTGTLDLVSLAELRERVSSAGLPRGRMEVGCVTGDVRRMHRDGGNAGALFQVASQFNLLEMTGPSVTPEDGVTRYQHDRTQGPACAIAAGAATIYRNYFAPVGAASGQTATRQLDGLADIGNALEAALATPVSALWQMQNGYALCSRDGLDAIAGYLARLSSQDLDALRQKLRIGLHSDIEVTDGIVGSRPQISHAFCSALPVAYTRIPSPLWEPFARLVLEAAYEATILGAILNATRGRSNRVLLTALGGGAFGNDEGWIHNAMARALEIAGDAELDVRLVSFGSPTPGFLAIESRFS